MRALVTGATGFIGRRLLAALDRPALLTRDPARARQVLGESIAAFAWDPEAGPPSAECFRDIEAVFHLAGEPVPGRWTPAKKQRIHDSRVKGTRHLVQAMEGLSRRPGVLVSVSAIGFYGDRGDEILDETSRAGDDFLAAVSREWEGEAGRARALGVRVATPRIGIVLHHSGGALARMLLPFRLGLGGRIGNGRQWMSWIHLDDLIGVLLHAAGRNDVDGPINAVAPAPVTNREFTRGLASVLRRPALFPVPQFGLKLAFGEGATILLGSQRVLPSVAEKTGYRFRYPELEEALRAAVR